MIRLLILATPLILSGCGQIGVQLVIAGASYVASANNLGAETLRFIDDKDARSCRAPTKEQL